MSGPTFSMLSHYGLIRFSGDDAQAFLNAQLSCDVAALTADRCTYGAYCTPKGRVLASFLLWRSDHGFFMQLPSSLREPIQKQLSKFILRSKVQATDATADWTLFGVAGQDSTALARKAAGQVPIAERGVAHTDGVAVMRLSADRYEIVVPQAMASAMLNTLAAGAGKSRPEAWDRLDILAGIPTVTAATQEAFVPQMVNLDLIGGVSFEKGCYPGQEIVARMHYRGTLKQRMYPANVASPSQPQPGDKLYSPAFGEQASGSIVNSAASPDGGFDALAVIQTAAAKDGQMRWNSPDGPVLALLPLPYAVPAQD